MAKRRITTNSIKFKIDIDGVKYTLSKLPVNEALMKQINTVIRDLSDEFVPFDSGALASDITVTAKSISYNVPYARYQYYGNVYGPNYYRPLDKLGEDPVTGRTIYDRNGAWGFRSPAGEEKHKIPDRYLVYNTEYHPNASSEWDKRMLVDKKDELTEQVTEILAPFIQRQIRINAAKANVW